MNPREIMMDGHRTVVSAIEALPEADWYLPGVIGDWSVKDLIAHLASYETALYESLSSPSAEDPTPGIRRIATDPQAFNDTEIARRRGRSAHAVWDEYERTHEANLRLVAGLPAEKRRVPGKPGWYPGQYDLEDTIAYAFYGHKCEHAAQIQSFKERLLEKRQRAPALRFNGQDGPAGISPANDFDLTQVDPVLTARLIHWIES